MADVPSTGSSNTPEAAPAAAPTASTTSLLSTPASAPASTTAQPDAKAAPTPPADPNATPTAAKPDAAPSIPEKYEFKLPENVVLDAKAIEAYTPVFKDLKLTQDQAQKLVDLEVSRYQQAQTAYQDSLQRQQQQWLEDSKAQFQQHEIEVAQSAIAAFGGKDFVGLLESIGVQNHPAVIRFARNVGIRLAEDSLELGGAPAQTRRDPASVLYPNHGTKQ